MNKIIHRFKWQREDEPQNMLAYVFLLANLVYGIAFTFFYNTAPVQASVLSTALFPGWVWGGLCLALVAATLYGIGTRKRIVGGSVGLPGVMVWGYALALAIFSGQLLAAFAVYLPLVLFWVFWHIGVVRYWDKEKQGR